MSLITEGSIIKIKSYKHNGKLHRVWEKNLVLAQTDEAWITVNDQVIVQEADGNYWRTKEPAISFFSKSHWFNIVAIFRSSGIYYYCNLASPVRAKEATLSYIDYDLDVVVDENKRRQLLDEEEFQANRRLMNYPHDVLQAIEKEVAVLYDWIDQGKGLFNEDDVSKWYQKYQQLDVKWDEM